MQCLQGQSVWDLSKASDDTVRKPANQDHGAREGHPKSSIFGYWSLIPQRMEQLLEGVHWQRRGFGSTRGCNGNSEQAHKTMFTPGLWTVLGIESAREAEQNEARTSRRETFRTKTVDNPQRKEEA